MAIFRSDLTREAASLSAETSFQVANSRNRVTQDVRTRRAGRSKVAVVRVIRARVLVEVYSRVSAAYPQRSSPTGSRDLIASEIDKRRSISQRSLVNRWTRSTGSSSSFPPRPRRESTRARARARLAKRSEALAW